MPNFVFTYYGEPQFTSPEDGAAYMGRWQAWVGSIGDAWVDPGHPLGASRTVSSSGVVENMASNRLTGFSIVSAGSIEAAIEMARRCPHLEHGTVDVSEPMEMDMTH